MYGWGGRIIREPGMADSDNPSEATIRRRRENDIAFLESVKSATRNELLTMRDRYTRGWRRIAIDRRLKLVEET
jgi:hypothetical protein